MPLHVSWGRRGNTAHGLLRNHFRPLPLTALITAGRTFPPTAQAARHRTIRGHPPGENSGFVRAERRGLHPPPRPAQRSGSGGEERPAVLRPARDGQDAHDPFFGRPTARPHHSAHHRRAGRPARGVFSAGSLSPTGHGRDRGRRPHRASPRVHAQRLRGEPAQQVIERDGRVAGGRRTAVRADHEPPGPWPKWTPRSKKCSSAAEA